MRYVGKVKYAMETTIMALVTAMLILGVWGCGESGPPESEPVEPTVVFEPTAPTEPQMLVGFFSPGAVRLPKALGALALGIAEDAARAELDRIRDPRLKIPNDKVIGDYRIAGGALRDWDVVGISVIFKVETGTVDQIDLSMPDKQALSALTAAYGEPTGSKTDVRGRKIRVWTDTDTQLQIELSDADDGRAVCKFRSPTE
jgi:hypothetical protein